MPCSASQAEVRLAVYRTLVRLPVRRPRYGGYLVPERAGRLTIVSQRFIQYAHETEVKVQVWTVDEEAEMRRLLDWGVDGLISNQPDLAIRVRDSCFP
jgi:glycerophosphoryl diester phosphodiesterase